MKSRGAGELEYSVFDFVFNVVQQSLSSVEKSGFSLFALFAFSFEFSLSLVLRNFTSIFAERNDTPEQENH